MTFVIKNTIDQNKLFKEYKDRIDPTFPLHMYDTEVGMMIGPFSMLKKIYRLVFKEKIDDPYVLILANKVRNNYIAGFSFLAFAFAVMVAVVLVVIITWP